MNYKNLWQTLTFQKDFSFIREVFSKEVIFYKYFLSLQLQIKKLNDATIITDSNFASTKNLP